MGTYRKDNMFDLLQEEKYLVQTVLILKKSVLDYENNPEWMESKFLSEMYGDKVDKLKEAETELANVRTEIGRYLECTLNLEVKPCLAQHKTQSTKSLKSILTHLIQKNWKA